MFEWGQSGKQDVEDRYQKDLKDWKAQRDSLLLISKQNKLFMDSVLSANRKLSDSIKARDVIVDKLTKRQVEMRRKNDSTFSELKKILPDTCGPALKLAHEYRAEADSLEVVVQNLQQNETNFQKQLDNLNHVNEKLLIENDKLKRLVITVPIHKRDRFLGFLPMPNRTTAALLGAAAGVGVGIYVTR